MKKIASLKYKLIIWFIGVIAYSVIVFVLASQSKRGIDKSIITTYIFMMIPLIFLLVSMFTSGNKKVFGRISAINAPSSMCLYFSIITFVFTTILYFFNYSKIIVTIILVYVLLVSIFLIFFVISLRQNELIDENPNKIPELTNINQLTTYLRKIFDKVVEPSTKSLLDELIELSSIQEEVFSHVEDIETVEKSIFEYASYLKRNIDRGEYANAYNNINKIKELLNKRTSLIK